MASLFRSDHPAEGAEIGGGMIYGLVLMIQDKEIKAHCFGDCGRASLAGIDSNVAGPLVPCRHDDCPWEEAKTPVVGQAFGEDLCIRKLRKIEG